MDYTWWISFLAGVFIACLLKSKAADKKKEDKR